MSQIGPFIKKLLANKSVPSRKQPICCMHISISLALPEYLAECLVSYSCGRRL